jgi:hypothetical protein
MLTIPQPNVKVTKHLGYGITFPTSEFHNIVNMEAWDKLSENWDAYETWLKKKHNITTSEDMLNAHTDALTVFLIYDTYISENSLQDAFRHYSDCEGNSVLMLTPPSEVKEWVHVNAPLDVAEYGAMEADSIANKFTVSEFNIFPFTGVFNTVTKQTMDTSKSKMVKYIARELQIADVLEEKRTEFCKEHSVETLQQIETLYCPAVPQQLHEICEWLNLFRNPETVWDLQPALNIHVNTVKDS